MARAREPDDWTSDLAAARAVERQVGDALASDPHIAGLVDLTASMEALDFSFTHKGRLAALDVKEKRQRYSRGVQDLWPQLAERDLFIVDETVFRRIIWQGGGGFLAIHDVPNSRWCYYGPWELTLGRRVRYGRWGTRRAAAFVKGKLIIDLSAASETSTDFDTARLASVIDATWAWRDRVEPYPINGARLRELGN